MRSMSPTGRWNGGIPSGTISRRVWLAAAGLAMVAVLAIVAVTCGADEPSSAEPTAAAIAEMFGGDDAGSAPSPAGNSATVETGTGDLGFDFWDILGAVWSAVSIAIGLIGSLLWAAIWGLVRLLAPLLTLVTFGWAAVATIRRSWYYERWNVVPRAVGWGVLASVAPLMIWIFG